MKLDLHDPREQAIANGFIKRFDKEHFRRLLINWIVAKNHSFSIAEEAELHAIFDYLNPSVSARKANITHTTVREKIVARVRATQAEGDRGLAQGAWPYPHVLRRLAVRKPTCLIWYLLLL
jgi:hypothetical protein